MQHFLAQPESVLSLLTALCRASWLALASMLTAGFLLLQSGSLSWQQDHQMLQMYFSVCFEYGLINLALHLALRFRAWYEQTPREAINRLGLLLKLVLIWNTVHFLVALHFFGGLQGPMAVALPFMLFLGFCMLQRTQAIALGCALLAGAAFSQYAQGLNFPYIAERWQELQLTADTQRPIELLIVSTCCLISILVGRQLNRPPFRLGELLEDEEPLRFAMTFSVKTLQRRADEELVRAHKHHTHTSYMTLKLQPDEATTDFDALIEQLQQLAGCIARCTRQHLDTVAYIGQQQFAILLPTAKTGPATDIARRIRSDMQNVDVSARLEIRLLTIADHETGDFSQMQAQMASDSAYTLN